MTYPIRIAVLVSGRGRGTNFGAILNGCREGRIPGAVSLLLSTTSDTPAMARAVEAGVEAVCLRTNRAAPGELAAETEATFDSSLETYLQERDIDLVCLAGFMRKVGPRVIGRYRNRIMNIHPSLLPAFSGAGMFGPRVHEAVLAYGAKITGCTVQFINEEYDAGPIILQRAVAVEDDDTAATLGARVLTQEHEAYVEAIRLFARDRLRVEDRRVRVLDEPAHTPTYTKAPSMKTTIKRALVSVYDKDGIVPFCQQLHAEGIEIISTGGTASALKAAGVPVLSVESVTGFPEMMDGRVKTLHPAIHGGLLADRSKPEHMRQIAEKDIAPIDLVVINLYPFEETIRKPNATFEDAIENIDIGGPSMIRSASKNYAAVTVLTDPADYAQILQEIREGGVTYATRGRVAAKAFQQTSGYDAAIAEYLSQQQEPRSTGTNPAEVAPEQFPAVLQPRWTRAAVLRYGENPHQSAAFYRNEGTAIGLAAMEQLSGKELSYLNFFDVNGALELVWEFEGPGAAIIKHASPCGAALGASTVEAYRLALECDPVSAFGGIVALSRPLDVETAQFMVEEGTFLEVVAAPDVEPEAAELLRTKKKNLRVLKVPYPGPASGGDRLSLRSVRGGVLVQDPDEGELDLSAARCVTRRQPAAEEMEQLAFAWKVVKHVKSNGVAIIRNFQAVGIGGGQTDRWRATRAAVANAGERAGGGVIASDAFFPFPDGPEEAAKAGVTAIVQPGGSIRDAEVIELADRYDLAMIFTGARHFRH